MVRESRTSRHQKLKKRTSSRLVERPHLTVLTRRGAVAADGASDHPRRFQADGLGHRVVVRGETAI
jgi:hypothetical protein